jgi:hypothetical protein
MKAKSSIAVDDAVMVILCLSGLRSSSYQKIHEAFWKLSKNKKFKNVLLGLDFESPHGSCYSEKLDKILSRFLTAGLLQYSNPRYSDCYIPKEFVKYAEKILASQSVTDKILLKQASLIFSQTMKE